MIPRYVGPYEILEKVRAIAYHMDLPTKFYGIQNVFHVSSLKKSFGDQTLAEFDPENIPLQPNLTYEEKLVQIIDLKKEGIA